MKHPTRICHQWEKTERTGSSHFLGKGPESKMKAHQTQEQSLLLPPTPMNQSMTPPIVCPTMISGLSEGNQITKSDDIPSTPEYDDEPDVEHFLEHEHSNNQQCLFPKCSGMANSSKSTPSESQVTPSSSCNKWKDNSTKKH